MITISVFPVHVTNFTALLCTDTNVDGLIGKNSASVVEQSFEYLDAPIERICGADVPMPYAANLERLAVPQVRFVRSCCLVFSFLFPRLLMEVRIDKFQILCIDAYGYEA